jgi:hypothetical protein
MNCFAQKKLGFDLHDKVDLVVPIDPEYARAAATIADALERTGCRKVYTTVKYDYESEAGTTVIALGNASNNDLIRDLYFAARDVTDRAWPGPGGWAIRSVAKATTDADALLLSVSDGADAQSVAAAFGQILESHGPHLPWLHQVKPGRWQSDYLDRIKDELPHPDASLDRIGGGSGDWDYMMAIGKVGMLAMKTADESLILRFATEVLRFHRVRFSERELEDPIQIHGFLRNLLRPFAMLEHHRALSNALRWNVLRGLLEIYRSTEGAANPDLIEDSLHSRVRQNHGTRTALDIYDGGLYFSRHHGLDEGREWMRLADRFFEPQLTSSKPVCDSWGHQWAGSLYNTADYALLAGRLDYFESRHFRDAADRALMAHTNLESGPLLYLLMAAFVTGNDEYLALCHGKSMNLPGVLPRVEAASDRRASTEDRTVHQVLAQLGGDEFGRPWICRSPDRSPSRLTGLSVAPVARLFYDSIESYAPYAPPGIYCQDVPFESTFDKISYRRGWCEQDTYLLLDGISGGSHSFQDANCLVRFTSHGQSWLGGPQYGRWTTGTLREQNGVSICCNGEGAGCESRYARLIQAETLSGVGIVCTRLDFPGIARWYRQIVIHPQGWILVVDEGVASKAGEVSLQAQWNLLGEAAEIGDEAGVQGVLSKQGDTRLALRQAGCDRGWLAPIHDGIQQASSRWHQRRAQALKVGESIVIGTLLHVSATAGDEGPVLTLSGRKFSVRGLKQPAVSIQLNRDSNRAKVARNSIPLKAAGRSSKAKVRPRSGNTRRSDPAWWCRLDSAVSTIATCDEFCLVGTKAGGLFQINSQGSIENQIAVGQEVSAIFADEGGGLLTGCLDGTLRRYDPRGTQMWSHTIEWQPMNWDNWTRGNCAILGTAMVECGGDRLIVAGCADRHLYGFSMDGNPLWRSPCKWGPAAHIAIAAIGPSREEQILVGMARPAIHAWCRVYDTDGNYVRALERPDIVSWSIPSWMTAIEVIDLDNDGRPEIIVGMNTNHRQIVVYRADGEIFWEADVGSSVVCLEQAHGRLHAGTEGGWIHGFDPDGRRRSTQTVHRPIRGISPVSPGRIIAVLDDGSVCANGQLTSSGIGPIIDPAQSTAHWPNHGLLAGADDTDRVALYC